MQDRMTARDLLEKILGEEHALHTIVAKGKPSRISAVMKFKCSCGVTELAATTKANTDALRNVPEDLK